MRLTQFTKTFKKKANQDGIAKLEAEIAKLKNSKGSTCQEPRIGNFGTNIPSILEAWGIELGDDAGKTTRSFLICLGN